VLGGDLLLLRSLGGGASPATISGSLALAPNGAFRGLVFEHVIGVAFAPEGGFVSTNRAVGSLVGWALLGAGLAGAALAYGRRVDALLERVRSRIAG